MMSSIWKRSANQLKRWLNISLCALLALQTLLFSPLIANAIGDAIAPTIDTFTATVSGGFFEQEIGGTFYTNDTTPTINATYSDDIGGTGIDSATASIRVNGDSAGFDSRDGSGISVTLSPSLPDATYSIEVVVKDGDGNEGTATKSLVIDTVNPGAPVITVPAAITSNNQTPTVSGTTEADSTVNIYDGPTLVATDNTTPAGTFSVATSSLAEGAHTLTAKATDRAGNVSGTSTSVVYTVDITNPTVDAGTDKIVNVSTPQDATVSDASGIASYAWSYVSGPGAVTFGTPTAEDTNISADTNGVYDLRLTTTDNAGNFASDDISFTWNSADPSVSIDAITSPSNDTTPTITGTATDPFSNIASVDYRIDGGGWISATAADGTFDSSSEGYTLTTAVLAEGSHLIEVRATDILGNVATSGFTNRTFVIDTTAPVITLNGAATITVEAGTAYSELGAGWTDAIDGAGAATVSGSVNTSVVGDYTISYNKTDAAGNAATTVTRTVQVRDTLKPTISGITPTDGTVTSDASVEVSATFSDSGSGVDTSSLYLDVDGVPSEGPDPSALFTGNTFTYAPGAYDDGVHTIDVSIADNIGNRMDTVSWSFTVTSAPTISSATVSGGRVVAGYINNTNTDLNVAGAVPSDSGTQTVQLFVNGSPTPLASVLVLTPLTTYSLDLSAGEFATLIGTPGTKSLQVMKIGSTGNQSGLSSFFDIFVDLTSPSTPDESKISVAQNAPGNNDTISGTTGALSLDSTTIVLYNSADVEIGTYSVSSDDGSFGPISIGNNAYDTVKVATRDIAGNESGTVTKLNDIVAPDAPVITSPTDGTISSSGSVTVSGTAEAGATVRVFNGPTFLDQTTESGGLFSLDLTLADNGTYGFVSIAVDAAGNTSGASNVRNYTFDNIAPTATGSSPANLALTNNNMVPISVTWSDTAGSGFDAANPPRTLTVGVLPKATVWNGSDTMAYTPSSSSADGVKNVTATITDKAGNVGTVSFSFTIDTVAPVITILGLSDMTVEIGSVYVDAGATALDSREGDLTGSIAPTSNVDTSTIGDYTVSYNVSDSAGNAAAPQTRTVHVRDTIAPTVNAGADRLERVLFTQTGTADGTGTPIASYLWQKVSGSGTVTFGTPGLVSTTVSADADGAYVIRLTVVDGGGNSTSDTFNLNWDATAPIIDSITGSAGTTGESTLVTVNASDGIAPTSATIAIDGGAPIAMTGSASPFTYDVPVPSGSTTSISYVVTVYDAAGNSTSSGTQTITVTDNDAPSGTVLINSGATYSSSPSRTVTLTLSATDNIAPTQMEFSNDGATWSGWETYGTSKSWIVTTGAGTKTVYAKFRDLALNESASASDTIIWDNTNPSTISAASMIEDMNGDLVDDDYTNNENVHLNWAASTDANSGIDHYELIAKRNSTTGTVVITGGANIGSSTNYTLSVAQAATLTPDGIYFFGVRAVDGAGNAGSYRFTDGIIIDNIAPVISLTGVTPVTVEKGGSYAELGATWTDAVDIAGAAVVTGDTVNPNVVATYTVRYNYTDRAGNAATEVTRTVNVVDTTAPILTQVTPVTSPTNNPHYIFNTDEAGTISYGGACSATTATTTATVGSNDITLSGLASGVYTDCTITVTDAYANASSPLSIPAFTIDSTAPTVTVNTVLTKDTTPALSGAIDDAAATISVRVNGIDYIATNNGTTWSIADNTVAALPDGIYNVAATATDALGNVGTDATTNELKIDNAAPIVLSVSPTGTISNRQPVISATLSDPIAGVNASTMVMRINGVAVATSYNAGTGVLSFTPTRDMALRTYTVTIDGKDLLGNTMTRYTWSFSIGSGV